jgi:YHS domain-containing protein
VLIRIILFALLVLFLLRAVWRLLDGVVEGATGGRRRGTGAGVPDRSAKMVRDPVCGTFVVQSRALSAARGSETAFFCSEDCRRRWQGGAAARSR